MNRMEVERRVRELAPWFHNIVIDGVATAPDHFLGDYPNLKWRSFASSIPADMQGMTVLDVGCNAGFFSFEMKRRGARRVVGIDSDERYLAQARFAATRLGLEIELRKMNVYEVAQLREKFDLVLFMGVLYHLRHPLLALDLLHEHVVGDWLLFQSLQRGADRVKAWPDDHPFSERDIFDAPEYPRLHFVESKYAGDHTNWWIPNRACVEAMLRSTGFEIVDHPEEEVYVCRRKGRERQSGEWEVHRLVGARSGSLLGEDVHD